MPVREAPALVTLASLNDRAHVSDFPDREPKLCVDNIQGNSLAGFNKDRQTLLFLRIDEVGSFREWLGTQIPFVGTVAEVLAFNRLFKAVRSRRGTETRAVQSTWMNIAFTHAGVLKLLESQDVGFTDAGFKAGLAARAALLNDPTDDAAEGSPKNWIVGQPGDEPHVVIIVAGDDAEDIAAEVRRIEDSLFGSRPGSSATGAFRRGATIIFKQHGATLPPPLTGHEHFGWLDGISQPAVRGTVTDAELPDPAGGTKHQDLLSLRQNPNEPGQGKPGQDALFPGEFVFGYPRQAGQADITVPGDVAQAGPAWSDDGSFVVFRRLRQDVRGFREWLARSAKEFGIDPVQLGSLLVGRWPSGSPVMHDAFADDPKLGGDDNLNNWFEFNGRPKFGATGDESQSPIGTEQPPQPDATGARCPFSAHIRKAYPRDDVSAANPPLALPTEGDTQRHRLLRRGIPFGPPFDPTAFTDVGDRGLLFVAYMTSIEQQFEFITRNWMNAVDFKDAHVGPDALLGRLPAGQAGVDVVLSVTFPDGNQDDKILRVPVNFITTTGGGYFFAPSIKALYTWCNLTPPTSLACRTKHPDQVPPPQPQQQPPYPPPQH